MSAKILNVSDREIPRYLNEEMLRLEGYDVVSCGSGSEALDLAKQHDFDIALLDVHMPGIDGFEVCRVLRTDPQTTNMCVLMTSATFVTTKSKVAGLDGGADGYLVQPFDQSELLATIRSLLRLREAERKATALSQELQRAMDARDEFLAMLGHELRNPLAAISMAMHLIVETKTYTQRHVEIVSRQTRNLGRIVDDLLDVARITRGKIALVRDPIDLRGVVERTVDALRSEITASRHEVTVSIPELPVRILGDGTRLEQVVSNLVTNAIKYTPPGGHIRVDLTASDEQATVTVTDDGVGLSEEMQSAIFDTFVQVAQTIDRRRGGLGLGLSVVRQLVTMHHGMVSASSDGENRGSRFVVVLPLIAEHPSESATVSDDVCAPTRLFTIAVIEDNDDARATLQETLARAGHRVYVATDGVSGWDLLNQGDVDVALIDIGLPGIDGYELARRLTSTSKPRPHLIAMTGYGQPEYRERAYGVGFDDHVVKPVVLSKLQALLNGVDRT